MRLSKFKKFLITGVVATTGIGITTAVVVPTVLNNNSAKTSSNQDGSNSSTVTTSSGQVNLSVQSVSTSETTDESTATNPATAEYKISITNQDAKEGKVYLINSENEQVTEMTFKPGDKLTVQMVLNDDYKNYTVRDLNVVSSAAEGIYIPSQNDSEDSTKFTIQMPTYAETLDENGKSSIYGSNATFTITPTFIQSSIGVDGNEVNWEHGAYADSLNGYVYNLTSDLTWSSLVNDKLYETFENKTITNPIDVYIYLHGYNLTLDESTIDLGIKSGWAIHIYNNKTDRKEILSDNNKDGYGEIKVDSSISQANVAVGGSIALGEGVRYKFIQTTDGQVTNGIAFISYSDTNWIGYQANEPLVRIGS